MRILSVVLAGVAVMAVPGAASCENLPAVLELFTSEGCSSCPPAEAAMTELLTRSPEERSLYLLEWHVDYWDYLGWKDPYSSAAITARQYDYARTLPSSVYTPQLVVNGTLVPDYAGNLPLVERLMAQARRAGTSARIEVTATARGAGSFSVHVATEGLGNRTDLLVALVEAGLRARPTAGENSGRLLIHNRVVRAFAKAPPTGGDVVLAVPAAVDTAKAEIVVLAQDQLSRKILAASRTTLPTLAASASWEGRIVDASGAPVPKLALQGCSDKVCVPQITDENGYFRFSDLRPGRYSLTAGSWVHVAVVDLAPGQSVRLERPISLPEGTPSPKG